LKNIKYDIDIILENDYNIKSGGIMDKSEYYKKSIIMKHINIKNRVLKIIFVIIMIIFSSCSVKNISNKTNTETENIDTTNNIEINKNNSSNNVKIELFVNDYRIINYSEELFYEDFIKYDLQIEIINIEKIFQLKDIIYPEIYLEYNNKIIIVKSIYAYVSAIWEYSFPYIDENNKLIFLEDNSIKIMGYIKIEKY
jgi:hypothetical protein